ncbi:MAG: type III-B CRISPR module RAMP protein Cmr4 [Candidatus Spyradosoma sp.]
MKFKTLVLFTRTPLHVGAGNSVGVVDSPVMRERHTRTPIIPGSSLKGVLADLWNGDAASFTERKKRDGELKALFGSDNEDAAASGALLVGEARALAFPLRSAKGGFAWITCPHALRKFARDTGKTLPALPEIADGKCLATKESDVVVAGKNAVVLEEYKLDKAGDVPADVLSALTELHDDAVWREVARRLVVVNDELFSYFVENACEVVTRIGVNDETGTVDGGALFNQEQVPSETLFYALVGDAEKKNAPDALTKLGGKLDSVGNVVQVGGDATIGLGFCAVKLIG